MWWINFFEEDVWKFKPICVYDFLMILDTLAWWNSTIASASPIFDSRTSTVLCAYEDGLPNEDKCTKQAVSCNTCHHASHVFLHVCLTSRCRKKSCSPWHVTSKPPWNAAWPKKNVVRDTWKFISPVGLCIFLGVVKRTEAAKNNSRKKEWIRAGRRSCKFPPVTMVSFNLTSQLMPSKVYTPEI